jgi:ribosomal protein S18 acetylase RimI-like enzyme
LRTVPLTLATAPAWERLFEACGSTCFCRYWHFAGNKNEWLARCFDDPEANRREQLAVLQRGAVEARGLLALEAEVAVGWIKLAPRDALPKLHHQGPYRALDLGAGDGVWVIACLLVHPAHRRRGVARALVVAAVDYVREQGGRAVEAYPRRADSPLHDEEAWLGTPALLEGCGFAQIAGEGPYPVMRRELYPTTSPAERSMPSRAS